uniref:Uncharacterized protein n=1 Tax=Oryza glumipatula TaxID=40148 RepID=A0A0D9YCP0_9ORYZ
MLLHARAIIMVFPLEPHNGCRTLHALRRPHVVVSAGAVRFLLSQRHCRTGSGSSRSGTTATAATTFSPAANLHRRLRPCIGNAKSTSESVGSVAPLPIDSSRCGPATPCAAPSSRAKGELRWVTTHDVLTAAFPVGRSPLQQRAPATARC